MKFSDKFAEIQMFLERRGHVCFSITYGEHHFPPTESEKLILDDVHRKKILISDCIIVIDVDGYIGQSTSNEIRFASLINRPVYYYSTGDLKEFGYENK